MLDYFKRKRAIFVLFLFACLACSSSQYQWKSITIEPDCPPITYTKLYLPPCNRFNGLEAEFLCTGSSIRFYLNALTLQFPHSSENEDAVEVALTIEEQRYCFWGELFDGNQRLLLPEEAQELVIKALLENVPVEITIGRYQTTLVPDNFACLFRAR